MSVIILDGVELTIALFPPYSLRAEGAMHQTNIAVYKRD